MAPFYMTFWTRQNHKTTRTERRDQQLSEIHDETVKGMRQFGGLRELFYTLTMAVVTTV